MLYLLAGSHRQVKALMSLASSQQFPHVSVCRGLPHRAIHLGMSFKFSIGGYSDSFELTCEHNLLTCVRRSWSEEIVHPVGKDVSNNEAWHRMLNYLSTRKWRKEYADQGILDGTFWELDVETPDFKLYSCSSNVYPPGFRKFLRLLNEVLEEDDVKVY